MASTTVKMGAAAKSQLEALQAQIKLETGRKVTQQELLAFIIQRAGSSKEEIVQAFQPTTVPLDEQERDRFHQRTSDWGIDTSAYEVDDFLYGEGPSGDRP